MTRALPAILLLSLLCFSPRVVQAQETHFDAITGEVRSSSGAPVPTPTVRVTAVDTRETRIARSFPNGRFVLVWVDGNGDYVVTVTAPGFHGVSRHVKRSGSKSRIDVQVKLKPVSGTRKK